MKTIEKTGIIRGRDTEEDSSGTISIRVVTAEELKEECSRLSHMDALIRSMARIQYCKAEVYGDCILGTIVYPFRNGIKDENNCFGYYVNADQVILAGAETVTDPLLSYLKKQDEGEGKTSADLLADLFHHMIDEDVPLLQRLEEQLSRIEEELLEKIPKNFYQTVIRYRRRLLALHTYYEQLINMTDMIEANHHEQLSAAECQRFAAFGARAERLHDHTEMLREYVLQIREMYQSQIDISQNRTMNLLTVVTSLFLPLTLLVGWYGMNFVYMPELHWQYSYLVMILVSVVILILEVIFFRKKGLL